MSMYFPGGLTWGSSDFDGYCAPPWDGYFIRVASSADPYDWPYSDDDEEDDDGPDDGALQEIGGAVVDYWSATKTLFKDFWAAVF
jgi:hypothetical protein